MKHLRQIACIIILLLPVLATMAQQSSTPQQTVKNLFVLLNNSNNKLYTELDCCEQDGVDIVKVNMPCIQSFVSYLQSTKLFSAAYLQEIKEMYEAMPAIIKKQGYATGLDADRYFAAQDMPEPKEAIADMKKAKTTIKGNTAIVSIVFTGYSSATVYKLVKENGNWVINKIGN